MNDSNSAASSPGVVTLPLGEHVFLHGLAPVHLQTLQELSMQAEFEADEMIFREGDPANRFYLIQSGRVALETQSEKGGLLRIETLGPGDVLGWSWFFPPFYWHFDAHALERTKALFFYATPLRERCEVDSALGYELMKRMATVVVQRLQATHRQLLAVASRASLPFPDSR